MKCHRSLRWKAVVLALIAGCSMGRSFAEGIPEPSLVLYGAVRHAATGIRVTVGPIQWTLRPTQGGSPIVVSGQLTNINDQFSYVLFVPIESLLSGQPATPNTLGLSSAPVTYDRSEVTVNGERASFVTPAMATFILTQGGRGKIEGIDLMVSASSGDVDGNGLPDDWEQAYFSRVGVDPVADPDGDGLTNAAEWRAGTNPIDAQSRFSFINVDVHPQGGILIEWSSVAGRTYTVLRSSAVTSGFLPVVTGVAATAPANAYRDATAIGAGPYFYLLRLEE